MSCKDHAYVKGSHSVHNFLQPSTKGNFHYLTPPSHTLIVSLSFALPPFLPLLLLASLVGELLSLLLSLPKLTTQEVTTDSINSSYINSCYNRSPACLSAPSSHLLTPPHNNGRSSPGRTLPKNCCFFFFFFFGSHRQKHY